MTDQRATSREREAALPEHETRPERDTGSGIVGEGWTATDADGDAQAPVDPDGMPGAAFDRRTMEAEGGEAELDDDRGAETDDEETIGLPSR
jgi:hypothetical protein